ncbi:hypothetical protein [Sulfitobacter sp.]|uniref:hypothetical protein n=1 Tax=Sulfitobacter sp. TaxID=1903071 RepID=UPI00272ACCB1|nr:hypothetical protein [Sulfitobacter sp.]
MPKATAASILPVRVLVVTATAVTPGVETPGMPLVVKQLSVAFKPVAAPVVLAVTRTAVPAVRVEMLGNGAQAMVTTVS